MMMVAFAQNQSGMTLFKPSDSDDPLLRTCGEAANIIGTALTSLFDNDSPSASIANVLTNAAAKSNAANIEFRAGRAHVVNVTPDQQLGALADLARVEADTASKFIRTAMLGPDADAALHCATNSANPADWSQCMPFREATWKWAEDAAAGGSFFQRLMFHGMNVLFFIWICLAPVVGTVMLMMGVRGIRLAGSYLLFGAWTVSWYVGASIVNFYVLKQVQYELDMLGSVGGMKLEGVRMLLGAGGVLETKIALAGEMLAQVPLLMMAVMSGSVYGLTALAQRFSGRDYYDESRNTPAVSSGQPIHARASLRNPSYDPNLGISGSLGYAGAPSLNESAGINNAIAAQQATTEKLGAERQVAFQHALNHTIQHGKMGEIGGGLTEGLSSTGATAMATMTSIMAKVATNNSMSTEEKRSALESLSATFKPGIAGVSAGMGLDIQRLRALGLSRQESEALESVKGGSKQFNAQLANEMAHQDFSRFAETAQRLDAETKGTTWGAVQKVANEYATSYQTQQSMVRAAGIARNTDFADLGRQINANPLHPDAVAIRAAAKRHGLDQNGDFQTLVTSRMNSYESTTLKGFTPEAKRTLATLDAMGAYGGATGAYIEAIQGMRGGQAMRGPEGQHRHPNVDAVRPEGSVTGAPAGTAAAARSGGDVIDRAAGRVAGGDGKVEEHHRRQQEKAQSSIPSPTTAGLESTKERFATDPVARFGLALGNTVRGVDSLNQIARDAIFGKPETPQPPAPQPPESDLVKKIPK